MEQSKTVIRLTIKNGKFVECTGAAPQILENYFVIVNGWECVFYPDGAMKCFKVLEKRESNNDMIFLKISSKGYYTYAIRKNGHTKVIKSFKLDTWPDNGSLVLVTRNNGKLSITFQDERYETFLNQHNIDALKREDPNRLYRINEYIWKNSKRRHAFTTIHSDGEIIRHSEETYTVDTHNYVQYFYDVEVTNATWVILTIYDDTHDKPLSTLFTKTRLEFLKDLPEIEH